MIVFQGRAAVQLFGCRLGRFNVAVLASLMLSTGGCTETEIPPSSSEFRVVQTPAAAGSTTPNLRTTPDGDILLSWVEPAGDGHALRFSIRRHGAWSKTKTVAKGNNWFINWADFPSVVRLGEDRMGAHFLAKTSDATYSYDVFITQSSDGGDTWSTPVSPHTDGTPTEHGFVSMLPAGIPGGTGVLATWLDGRNTASSGGPMTLRTATVDTSGTLSAEALLDGRICDCCQTSAAATPRGVIVAYRDRSDSEIRDISIVRLVDGEWTEPVPIHNDGWHISGCPVNGPSVASADWRVVVAWFTAANSERAVNVSLSVDGGETFTEPIRVDNGRPIGRVHTLIDDDGSVLVSWIEQVNTRAEIRIRRIGTDRLLNPALKVADISGDRANGFPRMAVSGNEVYVTWTKASNPTEVRVASATLE